MCNAWNHPINCHCGWGGDGHLGRSSGDNGDCGPRSYTDWAHEAYHSASAAYTNPNARCPVCQKRVYFYQSPEGGRVYFDELGPPWPKHPCTDQVGPKSVKDVTSISRTSASVRYEWQQDGWRPYICDSFALEIIQSGYVQRCISFLSISICLILSFSSSSQRHLNHS